MTTSEDINEATHDFLREHPDAPPALETLLDLDNTGSWTFDDVDMDSGEFGELVSRDIAQQTADGAYRLQHPDAVKAALAGETLTADETSGARDFGSWLARSVHPRELGGVIVVLAIVAGARLFSYSAVFRNGHVVSPGNDPYYYRYWQAQLLDRSNGVTDVGLLADMDGAATSRPLTHAVNWWFAELLGGTSEAAATVAAWLPIVGAVALGGVLYLLAKELTGDVRVGLAAVAFLGLAPVHVVYTNVGFLEHRLHQYLWLGILALTLTWLALDVQRRDKESNEFDAARAHLLASQSWAVAGVLGLAVAASVHTWSGSPLTFVPVAIYIAFRVVADVRAEIPPLMANAPAIGGLAGGSVVALGLHLGLGWHEVIAAGTPVLVTAGAIAVASLGEVWRRLELPAKGLLGTEALVGIAGLVGLWILEPIDIGRLEGRIAELLFREGATEAGSLFAAETAYILGPLWQIGISFYFGIAALAVATLLVVRRYEPGWLLAVCFAWYYLILAALQARFAAQLVFFLALFSGVGCVYLLAQVELARPYEPFANAPSTLSPSISLPRDRRAGYVIATVSLILIFNFIFVPTLVGQTTYSDEQVEAALAIEAHTTETERTYPETAVETRWDEIRMYNYFVNGESGSYDSRYQSFLTADNPDDQANRLRQGGKYVVINNLSTSPGATYDILYDGLGVGYGDVDRTAGRYQPVYIGDEVRAFTVVEGAVLNVSGTDGHNVTAKADIQIDGETITYERHGVISDGRVELRVAHAGAYTVAGETVTVTRDAVYDGEEFERSYE